VPARATVGVSGRQDCSQISAPAHRDTRSARLSHPTNKKLTAPIRCEDAVRFRTVDRSEFPVSPEFQTIIRFITSSHQFSSSSFGNVSRITSRFDNAEFHHRGTEITEFAIGDVSL
jgi:hypothetical protein